ncbi:dicarboxylate/amino acid:cation symporter [Halorarum salinum]|uniref:Dicarboxylate/amino acid:cation symporter n=1 Tax=Halorarum salinum TaxID=2743089 RepID=A0A7D5QFJ3_9EURY|nr:dicarboxylate/amino acid:cation symporter [Halobaculum salinum]QLG61483.1 dicarboxylate/amino acid:cation symporter [Halobaculum salinum]
MSTSPTRGYWQRYRSIPIVYRIGAAFVLGSLFGLLVGQPATRLQPLGDLFVRLLSMLIIPIVVFTLVMGARRLTPSNLGKIGGQVVVLYAITSAVAVAIGLAVANLINPGSGLQLGDAEAQTAEAPDIVEVFLGIVPENPIGAMASGDVLPTIFFAVVFGLALALVEQTTDREDIRNGVEAFYDLAEAGAEAMFKVVWGVMEYGVIGVFALMAAVFGEAGADALVPFALLIVTLALAVTLHIAVVHLGGIVALLVGQSPMGFLRGARDALITALSIRSSSGTLPVTMSNADENLQVEEEVYSFSLPLGATINMDGTALYQGVAAIFAANLVGVQLGLAEQFTVVAVAVLASVGAAGVPGTGLIMLTLVLTQLGLPLEVVGFVAGVDPILDRMRTMTNISGDLAVTTLVAKWNDAVDFTGGTWVPGGGTEGVAAADD